MISDFYSLGFSGNDCAIQSVNCTNNTCDNNGTCTAYLSEGEETGHRCHCLPYFTGESCEVVYDPCVNKCENNGTCESTYNGTYETVCHCTEYFTGDDCSEDINECLINNPCQNNATCNNDHGTFSCVCRDGFTGDRCETDIDDCAGVVCRNDGSCVDGTNNFSCNCTPGYSGKLCQWHFNQTCDGSNCSEDNTVQCIDDYEGTTGLGFKCSCIEGYRGDRCREKVYYCQNNSVCGGPERKSNCIELVDENDYTCECNYGYSGNRCEIDLDLCENSPCQNGGTCEDHGRNFICLCPPGYTGVNCSIVLCNNGDRSITCSVHAELCTDSPTGPICSCGEGYTGSRCETVFDPCDSNPCHSRATCVAQGNSYSCSCPSGYSDDHCTTCLMPFCNCPVDGCADKANNGMCNVRARDHRVCHTYVASLLCRKTAGEQNAIGTVMNVTQFIILLVCQLSLRKTGGPSVPPLMVA